MQKRITGFLLTLIVVGGCVILCGQTTALAQTVRYVDKAGRCAGLQPCYGTIADAVTAAELEDIIRVFPGVYEETVLFGPGKEKLTLEAHFAHHWPLVVAPRGGHSAVILRSSGVIIRHLRLAADGHVVDVSSAPPRTGIVVEENFIHGLPPSESQTFRGHGVVATNLTNLTVRNNQIRHVAGSGVALLGGASTEVADSLVEGNFIFKAGGTGIAIGGGLNRIKGNFILSAGDSGIVVDGERARRNVIEFNRVIGSDVYGIACNRLPLFAGGNIFRHNTAVASKECDLFDGNTNEPLPRNRWSDNKAHTRCGPVDQP